MPRSIGFIVGSAALVALAACDDAAYTEAAATAPAAAGNSAEQAARDACVRDVRSATGTDDVSVISSDFSEAGTQVDLKVGPTGTWSCIAYSDGTTANVMSTTDEGAL